MINYIHILTNIPTVKYRVISEPGAVEITLLPNSSKLKPHLSVKHADKNQGRR